MKETINVWVTRDRTPILGTYYAVCLFTKKPQMSNTGFWEEKGTVRNPVEIKITSLGLGDCFAGTLTLDNTNA